MKKNVLTLIALLIVVMLHSQNTINVTATGAGDSRDKAVSDAMRNAVSQACGAHIRSSTTVENFTTLHDAIVSRTEGYIKSYKVINESNNSGLFSVNISAEVSLDPMKQDAQALSQFVGGIRFLVMYDERKIDPSLLSAFEFAYERFNEKLIENNIRYVEKSRFDALKQETFKIMGSDTNEVNFVQKLGMFADAEFVIFINKVNIRTEPKAGGLYSTKVTIEAKAYDNCTSEGLGTVVLEGAWKTLPDKNEAVRLSISDALQNGYPRLMFFFTSRIGSWINGAPYELRFYGLGTPRNLRELINKLQTDSNFSGEAIFRMTENYININIAFKKKPFDMYSLVLDYADEIPALKQLEIDAKLLYGRQISFAPVNVVVPEAEQLKIVKSREQ